MLRILSCQVDLFGIKVIAKLIEVPDVSHDIERPAHKHHIRFLRCSLGHMTQSLVDVAFLNGLFERVLFVDVRMEKALDFIYFLFYTVNMRKFKVLRSHWMDCCYFGASSYLMEHRCHIFLL